MSEDTEALKEANNLTEEEIQRFLEEIEKIPSFKSNLKGKDVRLCFQFMEDTGCRVNETINIKKQDIDFGTRILTVMFPKSEKTCDCSTWRYNDSYSRKKTLEHADPNCKTCHGKGKWKKPQRTTITPRLIDKVKAYCDGLKDDEVLFPVSRQSLWKWSKKAGEKAKIRIFQQKDTIKIEGIFLHLFRALCSKRTLKDAQNDPFRDQLVACKLRHSFASVTDRYTKIDINYLWNWEKKTYGN